MKKMEAVIVLVLAACYFSQAAAIQTTASFMVPPYTQTTCFGEKNVGTLIVGIGNSMWNNSANCGKKMRVTCSGPLSSDQTLACKTGVVDVMIADLCEKCGDSINLSKEAFDRIALDVAGRVRVDYVMLS